MLGDGWIKLHRSLLTWEWYDDINTKVVFLHLLLTVNIKGEKWHGIEVKRGCRVFSYANLAKETRLSVRNVRTAIEHLKTTGEVTTEAHTKYSIISVINYDKYQRTDTQNGKDLTCSRHEPDKQATINRQQYKKVKERKESIRSVCVPDGTPEQTLQNISEMISELGYSWSTDEVERFIAYNMDRGRTTNWEYAAKLWEEKRGTYSDNRHGKCSEAEMTGQEIEEMNAYLSLVNRFKEDEEG